MKKFYNLLTLLTTLLIPQLTYAELNQIGTAVHREGEGESATYYVLWDTTNEYKVQNTFLTQWGSTPEEVDVKYSGNGMLLSYDAKRNGTSSSKVQVSAIINGTSTLIETISSMSKNNYTTYSNRSIDKKATAIRFFAKDGSLERIIKNVKVTMAKYIEFAGGATSVDLAIPTNVVHREGANATQKTVTFDWCNVNDLQISCDNANFEVVPLDEYSRAGAWGTTTLTIKCLHKTVGPHSGQITIYSATLNKKLTINVSSETTKKTPTFTWDIPRTMSIGEVKENVVFATPGSGELTLAAAEPATLLVEGLKVTAIGVGTTTLTASVTGGDEYYAHDSIITITVDNKERQTITWDQNLAVIPIGTEPIELNATTTSNLPLVYTSSNPDVASVEGNVLTILGEGRTTITVSQAGNNDYFATELSRTLVVYDPANPCNEKSFLAGTSECVIKMSMLGDWATDGDTERSFTWDATKPVEQLVFTVSGKNTFTLYIDAYRNGSSSAGSWKTVQVTKTTATHTINFAEADANITGVRFYLKRINAQDQEATFKDVNVYQKRYITPSFSEFTFNPLNLNATASKEITLQFSALASMSGMYLEKEDKVFSVENIPFGSGCGSVGSQTFKVTFSSVGLTTADCATYENAVLIVNSQSETILRIPISGKVEQLAQVIDWKPETTTINPFATITVPVTTSAALPIAYTSSDSTIAYVNEVYELVILKHGAVTITANAAGDNTYQAAKAVAHTFTINPVAYTVTITEIAAVEVGTALSAIALNGTATDEAGNAVEGQLTWVDGTIIPAAGTTAEYDVVFTPANANYYVASNHKVSVSVNKQTQTIAWEQETAYTMIDIITLNATSSAGLTVTYTSLNEEVATINDDNTLTLHKAGDVTIQAIAEGNESIDAAQAVEKTFSITLAPVTIAVNTIEAVTIGTALSEISLTGTARDANDAEVLGTFAFETPDTKPEANGTYTVIFTPENSTVYATATAQVEITVNKRTQTITWEPTETTLLTIDQLTLNATTSAEDITVTYTVLPEGIVTVSETGVVSILKAGEVVITANAAESTIYHAAEPVSHTFTIEPTAYTMSINSLSTLEAGQALSELPLAGLATDIAGNPVEGTFVWADPSIVPVAGSTAEYDVIFTPTNTNYYQNQTQKVSVSVNKYAHTIAWEQETAYTMVDVITLNATSSAGLDVMYTSLNEDVATVNEDNTLTLHKAGDITIQATAEGNEEVENAQPIEKTFTITLATVNITVNAPAPIDFNQALNTITLTGTAQDVNGTDVLGTFQFETPEYIPTISGTAAYNVIFKPTAAHIYAEATSQVEVTVNKQTQNILWNPETDITTIDILTLPATTDAGTAIKYESSKPTIAFVNDNFELVIVQAGEVTITATAEATEAYEETSIAHTFTISKATYELEYDFTELKLELGNALNSLETKLLAKGIDAKGNEVTGTLTFVEPNTIPTEIGVQTFEATFIPYNSNYYETQTVTLSVEVFEQAGTGTALDNIQQENTSAQKVLRDGKVYIIRDGDTYTITGLKL